MPQPSSSSVQQAALRDLDRAFRNFFAGRAKYPSFKRRTDREGSFVVRDLTVRFDGSTLVSEAASGDPVNKVASELVPQSFQCPSSVKDSLISRSHKDYAVSAREMAELSARDGRGDGIFFTNSGTKIADIIDGTSHTFMLLEQSTSSMGFMDRGSNPFFFVSHPCEGMALSGYHPGSVVFQHNMVGSDWGMVMRSARSFHPGGLNAAMADGSVTFVAETVDTTIWVNTFTPKGREVQTYR
jgi:prepilin-type processing-associated H-X9-DG protein